jgi:hypothetical protein
MSTVTSSFSFWGPVLAFVSIALKIPAASLLSLDAAAVLAGLVESDELLEPPQAATVRATATSANTATGERRIRPSSSCRMRDSRVVQGTA